MTTKLILEDITDKTKVEYIDKEKAIKAYDKMTTDEDTKTHQVHLKQYIPHYNYSYVDCITIKRNYEI